MSLTTPDGSNKYLKDLCQPSGLGGGFSMDVATKLLTQVFQSLLGSCFEFLTFD